MLLQPWLEQDEWDDRVAAWVGDEAELCGVSGLTADIRVYRRGDSAFKMRRFTPATVFNRPNSLEDEFLLLRWLAQRAPNAGRFPRAKNYRRDGAWEMLEMEWVEAPARRDPVTNPAAERWSEVWELARMVAWLNRLGCSHGDLKRENAGRNAVGEWVLMDFDQALLASPLRCFLRDFLGVPLSYRAALFTVVDRFAEARGLRLVFRGIDVARARLRRRRLREQGEPLGVAARCDASGDELLQGISRAWRLAARAGANNPGARVAYYSWDVGGVHFPGERPWVMRWAMIRRVVEFRGKRVVELGCNLGLLSLHAKQAGAGYVTGADHNAEVVQAASGLASTLGIEARFLRVDLDLDCDWEQELGEGDIVTLLSLTHWLKDKDRVWRYAARFRELLFEGHEPMREISDTLRGMGFNAPTVIGVSERNRAVLYAARVGP